MMSTGTGGPIVIFVGFLKMIKASSDNFFIKLYARNNIFKKGSSKYEILNHLYFGPNFVFWGLL